MSAIFIAGTGTDIGKTHVCTALIRHLRDAGRRPDAIKPVMSGFDPADPASSDAGRLLAALGRDLSPQNFAALSPWRFSAPLSPDQAAELEGCTIDFGALVAFTERAASRSRDLLLIEGVGGVMVPLGRAHTTLDWMESLRLPVVLIAGSYLGAISHTLTAIDALLRHNLEILALVVNETPGSSVALDATLQSIGRFAGGVPLVALRRGPDGDRDTVAALAGLLPGPG